MSRQSRGNSMIECQLAQLIGKKGLTVTEVARATGINRSTVTALCRQRATRVELPVIESLCTYFSCQVGDLFQIVTDANGNASHTS